MAQQVLTGGISTERYPNWDSKGRIYYTDENGNVIPDTSSFVDKLVNTGRKLKATAHNIGDWINETNPDSEAYKQKANLVLGLTTAPFGMGATATKALGAKLAPVLGNKIAQMTAQGLGGGLVSGGVEGFGRGLIEGENPLKTALTDAGIGTVTGGLGGLALGNAGKYFARKGALKNPNNAGAYIDDYVSGITNPNKADLRDMRAFNMGGELASGKPEILYDQTNWHGSPYDFENFDFSKMGSGEGAQAHGWGGYSANERNIADTRYRDKLSGQTQPGEISKRGLNQAYAEAYRKVKTGEIKLPQDEKEFFETVLGGNTASTPEKYLQGNLDGMSPEGIKFAQDTLKDIENVKKLNQGQLYELSIPDEKFYLDEDLPFSQQSPEVQESLKKMINDYSELDGINYLEDNLDEKYLKVDQGIKALRDFIKNNKTTGKKLYKALSDDKRSFSIVHGMHDKVKDADMLTSYELDNYGIKGITYNGGIDGRAHVTFNPANMKIVGRQYPSNFQEKLMEKADYDKNLKSNSSKFQEMLQKSNDDFSKLDILLQNRLNKGYYKSPEEFYRDYSILENLRENNIPVADDGTVKLYHATYNKNDILNQGQFLPTTAAKGGTTGYNSKSVFFGADKDWVNRWSGDGTREVLDINVPFEYIKQPAQNEKEIYLDGIVKRIDADKNLWIPQDEIVENFYTRIPALRSKLNLKEIFQKYNKSKFMERLMGE